MGALENYLKVMNLHFRMSTMSLVIENPFIKDGDEISVGANFGNCWRREEKPPLLRHPARMTYFRHELS